MREKPKAVAAMRRAQLNSSGGTQGSLLFESGAPAPAGEGGAAAKPSKTLSALGEKIANRFKDMHVAFKFVDVECVTCRAAASLTFAVTAPHMRLMPAARIALHTCARHLWYMRIFAAQRSLARQIDACVSYRTAISISHSHIAQ
jgi:hypothetical protein